LWPVLHSLPPQEHPALLIGTNQADDSAVLRLRDDLAIILSVDYFPAIVDDPYVFGQVAAANALSDIYAMGGTPLSALNIIAFPEGKLPLEALELLMRGGAEKVNEAGAVIVGGHTLKGDELTYGLSVVGTIHPDRIVRKVGAKPGDILVLTKPLGTGLYSTALKQGSLDEEQEAHYNGVMTALNAAGSRRMVEAGAHACTDVTGFGLAGHALEMAQQSGVTMSLYFDALPLLPRALEFAAGGFLPGGGAANQQFASPTLKIAGSLTREQQMILYDPQTSGGLLIAVAAEKAEKMVDALHEDGVEEATIIGEVLDQEELSLVVRG
jgi:selenide,water dikinase